MGWFGMGWFGLGQVELSWIRAQCREWGFGIGRREIRLGDRGRPYLNMITGIPSGKLTALAGCTLSGASQKSALWILGALCSSLGFNLNLNIKKVVWARMCGFFGSQGILSSLVSGHFPYSVTPLRYLIRVTLSVFSGTFETFDQSDGET